MPRPPSHRRPTEFASIPFGVCYYPEHWDEATRARDPERMAAAGVRVVRMGEFAWDLFESEPGRYDFSLHRAAVARLGEHGIRTILCTPTAAPPAWLTRRHPEILRVDAKGVRLEHGSRQHASHMAPAFRAASRAITQAMAEAFRGMGEVIGWQTDNEFHCHFSEDHSDAAQHAFRDWLRRRYAGDIAELNAAWGTAFWAQSYRGFDEIATPKDGLPTYQNPHARLDYVQFLSDAVGEFQAEQIAILRAVQPRWWITHNGLFNHIDYRGPVGADLDVLGWDCYPHFIYDEVHRAYWQARGLDWARSWTGNLIVPEQQAGPGGQAGYLHDVPEPGAMRAMALTSFARGADGLLFFRWRTARVGAEMHWYGILDHDDVPRRRYRELAELGRDVAAIEGDLLGTHVRVDAAIAGTDYRARSIEKTMPIGLPGVDAAGDIVHGRLLRAGIAVGFVNPADDLDAVRLLVVPHWEYLDPDLVPRLTAWVEAGGVLVLSARCGTRDQHGRMLAEPRPGPWRALAGITVEEFGRHNRPERAPVLDLGGTPLAAQHWSELLTPAAGTEVVAAWRDGWRAGQAAITRRSRGRGQVWYIGAWLTEDVWVALQPRLLAAAAVTPLVADPPADVIVSQRVAADRRLTFAVNHAARSARVMLPAGTDLLSGAAVAGACDLPPWGAVVIRH